MTTAYHTHEFQIPTATGAEVAAGVDTGKVVTPATLGSSAAFATAAQGLLADTAVQPADISSTVPVIAANTMLVDNAAGTARETKTFAQVNERLGSFTTKTLAAAATIDTTITSVRLGGGTTLGDGLGGLYISTNNGSADTFSSNGGTRTWYRALFDLPTIASGDTGKIVAVNATEDGFELEVLAAASLPTPTVGDAGKVVSVNVTEDGYDLEALTRLPAPTVGNAGKIPGVNAAGNGYELLLRREVLTADRTYYVRIDGSDSNNGLADTAGGAFLTGARALAAVASIDLNGYIVTIQFGSGTFSGQLVIPRLVGQSAVGSLIINGVGAATILTSNSVFRGTVSALTGAMATVKNATIINTNANGFGIEAAEGGVIKTEAGLTFGATGIACIGSNANGIMLVTAPFTVTVDTQFILRAVDSANIQVSGSGTIALGTRTVISTVSVFDLGRVTFQSLTWSGTVTGMRFWANGNGVIQTYGGGPSFFPGSVAGTTTNGGLYA